MDVRKRCAKRVKCSMRAAEEIKKCGEVEIKRQSGFGLSAISVSRVVLVVTRRRPHQMMCVAALDRH